MNKTKKIAFAVVSVVMAGSMAMSVTACGGGGGGSSAKTRSTSLSDTRFNASGSDLKTVTVGGLSLNVRADNETQLAYPTGTTMNVNIIDSGNESRRISYQASQIASYWDGLDGYTYYAGDLKPAWWQFGQTLGIDIKDKAASGRNSNELKTAVDNNELADYNLINASMAQISTYSSNLLDLNKYLDYMPNYKAFLDQNEIVKYSLTMETTGENAGAMYYIPYFDGNNDIEKYEIVQRSWVRTLLDEAAPSTDSSVTFAAQASSKNDASSQVTIKSTEASASSFMGQTAENNWVVETTKPGSELETIYVKCDYGKVIEALQDTSSALYTAVNAVVTGAGSNWNAEKAGTLTASGNIVDIMNYVINGTQGNVKGSALTSILKEYIKVAYYYGDTAETAATSATAMYGATVNGVTTKLSDVFLATYAAWDADLLTAIFRCVVTNYKGFDTLQAVDSNIVYALAGREGNAQRQNDLIAFAGELYGVRGMESRLSYNYIDANGNLQNASAEEASYDAAAKLNDLTKEGLVYTGSEAVTKYHADGSAKPTVFMLHDYLQTQTTDGFLTQGIEGVSQGQVPDSFDFAPILTPVSKWDTDSDGTAETTMRFTESWRSVKNTGVCVPLASVQNNPAKLSAVLSFIDYLYSNDGQIVGSYGPMSTKGNVSDADGFWYGNPVTATIKGVSVTNGEGDLAALKTAGVVKTNDGVQYYVDPDTVDTDGKTLQSKYFMYDNVLYTGTDYGTRQVPTMTDNNMTFYLGATVNGNKMSTSNSVGIKENNARNYTNYARGIVGAALPIGNKDQGFEYQCTADCGLDGGAVVSAAIVNGTIKHVTQNVDSSTYWYTEAATCLPTDSTQNTTIADQTYLDGSKSLVGIYNPTSTAGYSNVYIDLVFYGYNTNIKIGTVGKTDGDYSMQANASALVTYIKGLGTAGAGLEYRVTAYQQAWAALVNLFEV